jgi:hypothetical protein
MPLLDLKFSWIRDPEGYDIEFAAFNPERPIRYSDNGPSLELKPDENTPLLLRGWDHVQIVGKSGKEVEYQISGEKSEHFIEFAAIRNSAQAIQFFKLHGPLETHGREQLSFVLHHAKVFQSLLPKKAGLPKTVEVTRLDLVLTRLDLVLIRAGSSKSRMQIVPRTLLSLMYLQLAQSLAGERPVRRCKHCDELFEVGPGTGRKSDSKYCTKEHQVLYNSLKRSLPPGAA